MELLIRLEAGQLHRAAEAAVELITLGEQHGFDFWALVGTAQYRPQWPAVSASGGTMPTG